MDRKETHRCFVVEHEEVADKKRKGKQSQQAAPRRGSSFAGSEL
jgi:hypothetical protein